MTSSDSGDTTGQPDQGDGSALPPTHQPYGQPPAENPYGQTPAQPPYGQPQSGDYSQPGYPPVYGAPQQPGYGYGTPAAPNHPSATTAFVLSLIGLAGLAFCGGITLVLSPFAWRIGAKAVSEIDASPGTYGGRDQANAARIMGIIGTVLLVLGIVVIVLFVVGLAVASYDSSGY